MCIIQQLILSSSIQPHQKVERLCEPLRDIQSAPTLTPESPPPPLPPRKGGGGGGRGSSFIKSFAALLRGLLLLLLREDARPDGSVRLRQHDLQRAAGNPVVVEGPDRLRGDAPAAQRAPELKGSIGEGPNHSNFSEFGQNSCKFQEFSPENSKNAGNNFNIF